MATPPAPGTTKQKLRDSSFVTGATLVFTVATAMVFSYFGVPLHATEDYAVVAGFWFLLSAGGLWVWRRFTHKGP